LSARDPGSGLDLDGTGRAGDDTRAIHQHDEIEFWVGVVHDFDDLTHPNRAAEFLADLAR
jgi:hypothetical protein